MKLGKWTRGGKKSEGRTFQETHRAVEAFWTEFVISKGAQQFTDNNVHRFRKNKRPHVAKQNADLLPPFGSLALLQTKRRYHGYSRWLSIWAMSTVKLTLHRRWDSSRLRIQMRCACRAQWRSDTERGEGPFQLPPHR